MVLSQQSGKMAVICMLLHMCAAQVLLLPRCLLHRLPYLECVNLTVAGDPQPLSMGTVLYSLRA
jgi:hypothetical protein